jgi:hypothetical protein
MTLLLIVLGTRSLVGQQLLVDELSNYGNRNRIPFGVSVGLAFDVGVLLSIETNVWTSKN